MRKQYGPADDYERKLYRVMERLGVKADDVDFNWDRWGCWVTFRYKGGFYRFDHSIEKARRMGVELRYGSDAFAQVVLALEDLARMVERGIYDLQTWVAGLKALPPAEQLPACLLMLQFDRMPADADAVRARYREVVKTAHPDAPGGGDRERFEALTKARDEAVTYVESRKGSE